MNWAMLHGGALGDLVLSLHLAARVPAVRRSSGLTVYSRVTLPRLRIGNLPIWFKSPDSISIDWLFRDSPREAPPDRLTQALADRPVLNLLTHRTHPVHARLLTLQPTTCVSIDTTRVGATDADVHVVRMWERHLAEQGVPSRRYMQLERCRHRFHWESASPAPRDSVDMLIHAGSGGVAKCWPMRRYADLARSLTAAGRTAAFMLGPAELERWPYRLIAELRDEFRVCECIDLSDLTNRLAGASTYVGNDTGPTHLAAALGVPTVALFGPTRAACWRPLGRSVQVIQGNVASGEDWGISPDAVRDALLGICSALPKP